MIPTPWTGACNRTQSNNERGITQTLANFAATITYEELPPDVVDWAKYLCLDFAGVTLNGSTTDSAKTVVQALESVGRSGPQPCEPASSGLPRLDRLCYPASGPAVTPGFRRLLR